MADVVVRKVLDVTGGVGQLVLQLNGCLASNVAGGSNLASVATTAGDLRLLSAGGGGVSIQAVTGNVGIGSTAPGVALDVSGAVRLSGSLSFGGELLQNGAPYVGSQWTTVAGGLTYGSNVSIAGTLYASNLAVLGSVDTINAYTTMSSNLVLANLGTGPALSVSQVEYGPLGAQPVATFTAGSNLGLMVAGGKGFVGVGGVTSPTAALDVSGDVNFTGTLMQNGAPYAGSQWSSLADGSGISIASNVAIVGSSIKDSYDAFTNLADYVAVSSNVATVPTAAGQWCVTSNTATAYAKIAPNPGFAYNYASGPLTDASAETIDFAVPAGMTTAHIQHQVTSVGGWFNVSGLKVLQFSAGTGGAIGNSDDNMRWWRGAGGGGGVVISTATPIQSAETGLSDTGYNFTGGGCGVGFGAGGGGGTGTTGFRGGVGASGFAYIYMMDGTNHLFTSSGTYTVLETGVIRGIVMGEGGQGGCASTGNMSSMFTGGCGGGAGYITSFSTSVNKGDVISCTISMTGPGQNRVHLFASGGSTTVVVINGTTYSAAGGEGGQDGFSSSFTVSGFWNMPPAGGSSSGGKYIYDCKGGGAVDSPYGGFSAGGGSTGMGAAAFAAILPPSTAVLCRVNNHTADATATSLAIASVTGVDAYTTLRLQGGKGRMMLNALAWSSDRLRTTGNVGSVHADLLVGNLSTSIKDSYDAFTNLRNYVAISSNVDTPTLAGQWYVTSNPVTSYTKIASNSSGFTSNFASGPQMDASAETIDFAVPTGMTTAHIQHKATSLGGWFSVLGITADPFSKFSAGYGGRRGSNYVGSGFTGTGGAGGVSILNAMPVHAATNGLIDTDTADTYGSGGGVGFGAGGGGGSGITGVAGGTGASGFVYVYQENGFTALVTSTSTITVSITGTLYVLMMGGGGGGGCAPNVNNASYYGGYGGGAGYLNAFSVSVTAGDTVACTVYTTQVAKATNGGAGYDGVATTAVIKGVTYTANGGKGGLDGITLYTSGAASSAAGSTSGGNDAFSPTSPDYPGYAGYGYSAGNGPSGMGATAFTALFTPLFNRTFHLRKINNHTSAANAECHAIESVPGVDAYAKLRIQGGKGRMMLDALAWSSDRLRTTGNVGSVHADLLVGPITVVGSNVGIGTTAPAAALHVVGTAVVTGDIAAFYSDDRLKTRLGDLSGALDAVRGLSAFRYAPNDVALLAGFPSKVGLGLSAQEVGAAFPEIVTRAPFDIGEVGGSKSGKHYLTIQYERMVPVLVQAIQELSREVEALRRG